VNSEWTLRLTGATGRGAVPLRGEWGEAV